MRALHAAERQLLLARLNAERQADLDRIAWRHRSIRAAAMAAVTQRYADRRRALSPMLSLIERAAALQRLALEEAGEIAVLTERTRLDERNDRRLVAGAGRLKRRMARTGLRRRQVGERVQLSPLLPTASIRGPLHRARYRPRLDWLTRRGVAQGSSPKPQGRGPRRR